MATHSSSLAWRIPWTEESGGLQSVGLPEWDVTKHLHTFKLPTTYQFYKISFYIYIRAASFPVKENQIGI